MLCFVIINSFKKPTFCVFGSCDVVDTFVLLHTSVISLVYNVIDTNCWAHNGCTHCGVFKTFKHRLFFFNKQDQKKWSARLLYCFHVIPTLEKLLQEYFSHYSCEKLQPAVFMLFLSAKNCCVFSFHVIPIGGKLL